MGATQAFRRLGLGLGLDAFGHDGQAQRIGQHAGRADDGAGRRLGQGLDHAAVELERRDRQAAQQRQRALAGAEVVEGDTHAGVAQPRQLGQHPVHMGDGRGLGDLDLDQRRVQPVVTQHGQQPVGKAGILELQRRHIDRDRQHGQALGPPAAQLLGRLAQQQRTEGDDLAGALGRRDEFDRADPPEARALPAHQGFEAAELAAAGHELGLVLEHELALFDGGAERLFDLQQRAGSVGHAGLEEHDGGAGLMLGAVHGGIGRAQQGRAAVAMRRKACNADGHVHIELPMADAKRRVQQRQQGRAGEQRAGVIVDAGLQQQELVFSQPCQQGLGRQGLAQAPGHGLQQRITHLVAEAFIDELETVQVGRQQREAGVARRRQLGQPRHRRVPVGQIGQLVMQGLAAQRLGGPLALGVVDQQHQQGRIALPLDIARAAAQVEGMAVAVETLALPADMAGAVAHDALVALPRGGEVSRLHQRLGRSKGLDALVAEQRQGCRVGIQHTVLADHQ
mmetsp:Transcript_21607/g.51303  ORF Transcript_21607/g.51303 Transcript_21607/m.51303 type:complete len:509 (+) Transcript_21607:483-2009(+)